MHSCAKHAIQRACKCVVKHPPRRALEHGWLRILKCLAVVLLFTLSACGGQSTSPGQTTDGATSDGVTTDGVTTDGTTSMGSTDAGDEPTGPIFNDNFPLDPNADVDGPHPVNVRISTDEEVSVDGSFMLIDNSGGPLPTGARFFVIAQPLNGFVIHDGQSQQFTYAPKQDFFGIDDFVYADSNGLTATVRVDVANINDPPVIFDNLQRVVEQGTQYTELIDVVDVDREALLFEAQNLPAWLSLDVNTGVLSGIPKQTDVGIFDNITLKVTDMAGLSSSVSGVRIEVIDINDAPIIDITQFPSIMDAGSKVSINLYPEDPDGEQVQLRVEENAFLTHQISGSSVQLEADNVTDVTDINLVIVAKDVRGSETREIIPITIHPITDSGRGRTLRGRESGEGIHLVLLGDGYKQDEMLLFREHTEKLISLMQDDPGMQAHFSAWNVHMIETPSAESGIDDSVNSDIRNTVFNTGYFCRDVERLICGNTVEMFDVAISEYPNFDQIVLLVNDPRYGGSGGTIAISTASALEIALHEMGHSIAGLADEYVDPFLPEGVIAEYVEGKFANVSSLNDPALVPWSHWIDSQSLLPSIEGDLGVGVFEGAYYQASGFYRPTSDSLMRSYLAKLGPVNSEQWALSVYENSNPVLALSPINRTVEANAGNELVFSVYPLFDGTVQAVEWRLNRQLIANSGGREPSVTLSLPAGEYTLDLLVRDISGLIRKPGPHAGEFNWSWTLKIQ